MFYISKASFNRDKFGIIDSKDGVHIIAVCTEDNKSVQEELVEDMMFLIASFSGRLYGLRSSNKRKLRSSIDSIPDIEE